MPTCISKALKAFIRLMVSTEQFFTTFYITKKLYNEHSASQKQNQRRNNRGSLWLCGGKRYNKCYLHPSNYNTSITSSLNTPTPAPPSLSTKLIKQLKIIMFPDIVNVSNWYALHVILRNYQGKCNHWIDIGVFVFYFL